MAEEYQLACPNCSEVFAVPDNYAGEIGECVGCEAVFTIPDFSLGDDLERDENGVVKGVALAEDDRTAEEIAETVKLERKGAHGMIPDKLGLRDHEELSGSLAKAIKGMEPGGAKKSRETAAKRIHPAAAGADNSHPVADPEHRLIPPPEPGFGSGLAFILTIPVILCAAGNIVLDILNAAQTVSLLFNLIFSLIVLIATILGVKKLNL